MESYVSPKPIVSIHRISFAKIFVVLGAAGPQGPADDSTMVQVVGNCRKVNIPFG